MKKKLLSLVTTFAILISSSQNVLAIQYGNMPTIRGKGAITMDLDTKEIIYAKDIDAKHYKQEKHVKGMYPASTTKLLTALLLAENKQKDSLLTYTIDAKRQPAFSINLNVNPIKVGEQMTADDALKYLLLYSANDIAYVIADGVGGNGKGFEKLMNEKIQDLSKKYPYMKNTHFITPNGLHNQDHYTTPYDLTVIGRAAFANSWIKDTMKLDKCIIKTFNGKDIKLENRNKLLLKDNTCYDATCLGGKTGYTVPAGRCLVAFFERDGRKMVGVVMASIYDNKDHFVFEDMENIINWSYDAKKVTYRKNRKDYIKDTVITTETLNYKPFGFFGKTKEIKIPLLLKDDIKYYKNSANDKDIKLSITKENITPWTLTKNSNVGTIHFNQRELKKDYPLYTTVSVLDILKDNIGTYFTCLGIILAILIIILILIAKIKQIRRRKRRKRSRFYR